MTEYEPFEPFGEITLGGDRIMRVVKGGLDLFIAVRKEGGHGRPLSLGDRVAVGGETPYLPGDDRDYVYYARALPGTQLVRVDAARCKELAASGYPKWLTERQHDLSLASQRATDFVNRRYRHQRRLREELGVSVLRLFGHGKSVTDLPDRDDPLMAAARRAARMVGIPSLRAFGEPSIEASRLNGIAELNRLHILTCELKDKWWKEDYMPLLVIAKSGDDAFCISRDSLGRGVAWSGRTGESFVVNAAFADEVLSTGWCFVLPFPDGPTPMSLIGRYFMVGNRLHLMRVIFFSVELSILNCCAPIATSKVFSDVVPNADYSMLWQLLLLSTSATVAISAASYVHFQNITRLKSYGCHVLQLAIFDRLLRLPVSFFRKYRPAEMASRATSCVTAIMSLGNAVIKMISNVITIIMPSVMIVWYSPALSVVLFLIMATFIITTIVLDVMVMGIKSETFMRSGRLTGLTERYVRGANKVRSSGAVNSVFTTWAKEFCKIQGLMFRTTKASIAVGVIRDIMPALISCASAAVVVWAYYSGVREGAISMADFAGFVASTAVVTSNVCWILHSIDPILRSWPSLKWLKPILDEEIEYVDSSASLSADEFQGAVELDHVSFTYPGGGRQILNDVSIKAAPGEYIALTGESGAGKSTALRLMLRFESPDSGEVLYDGKDIANCDMKALRSRFGVVMQSAAVMPDTIFRNIAGYSGAYTEEEVWEAARLAGCESAITAFPQQLNTVLSEGTVSGGQRQRFLLAHAFIRKPKVFFLDEATSALDNATQSVVIESLAKMKATRIVVAHRLSTVRDADRIYVLDHGKIVEVGTFDELIKKNGYFARSARRQMIV